MVDTPQVVLPWFDLPPTPALWTLPPVQPAVPSPLSITMAIAAENAPDPGSVLHLRAQDGVLVLELDPQAAFEALRQGVRELFGASPDRFRGMDARLDLKDRGIDLFDLRRLIHVLKDEFGVTVTGLMCTQENLQRFAERELKLRIRTHRAAGPELVEAPPTPLDPPEPPPRAAPSAAPAAPAVASAADEPTDEEPSGRRTLVLERSLRSGQVVRHGGDVLVMGDVHPGSEVIAAGNVLVMGALRGLAHAGCRGDAAAFVMALELRPTQLRIGRNITMPGERQPPARAGWFPEIAWVNGADITIEPYAGRLPR